MKFKEILNRLTGFSTPIFGVSWNPPKLEIEVAKRIITQLEDGRVLYNPSEMELPEHCVRSVTEIRHILTHELSNLDSNSNLATSLRAMRSACRKFLDATHRDERIIKFGNHLGHYASWHFNGAVGELRGVFVIHIAQIAAQYRLDIEDQLATILPVDEKETEKHGRQDLI